LAHDVETGVEQAAATSEVYCAPRFARRWCAIARGNVVVRAQNVVLPYGKCYSGACVSAGQSVSEGSMGMDFETEPEFQAQLDWVDTFVREEVEPLRSGVAAPAVPRPSTDPAQGR